MKSLFISVAITIGCAVLAQVPDTVRSSIIGEMTIRAVPPVTAATVSVKASDYVPKHGWKPGEAGIREALDLLLVNGYEKLARWMKEGGRPNGPSFVIFEQDPATARPEYLSCKIGYPVSENESGRHLAKIERLPSQVAAVVRYQGAFTERAALRDSLGKWITARGYAPTGPLMEIYVRGPQGSLNPGSDFAELRLPVRKLIPVLNTGMAPPQLTK